MRLSPQKARPTKILAPNGKPAGFLYQTPRTSGNYRGYRPMRSLSADTKQNISSFDRRELVDLSRQVYARVDIVGTAVEQKNNWAFGDSWDPYYTGELTDNKIRRWVEEATEFIINQFYPFGNIRGPQFDFRTSMKLSGEGWDRDGDDLLVLTESETHFPMFSLFPGTRVGNLTRDVEEVKSGSRLDGAKVNDGVVLDRNNRIVGVQLLNEEGEPEIIDSYNAKLEFEAKWCDQLRGLPRIGKTLLPLLSLYETDDRLMGALKRACGISFKIKNAEGEAGNGNEAITETESPSAADTSNTITGGSADRKICHEELPAFGGEVIYLSSLTGEDLDEVKFTNPHPNVEAFIKRIQHGSIQAIGWHYELMNLGDTGRAATRTLAALANQTIWDRQCTGIRRFRTLITYALAKAAKHGFISKPPSPLDYARWKPGLPALISCDAGNDAREARENIKMGLTTVSIEAAKAGYHSAFLAKEGLTEWKQVISDADEIYALIGSKGITYEQCLQMRRQTNPNPPTNQNNSAAGSVATDPAKSDDEEASASSYTFNIENNMPAAKRKVAFKRDSTGAVIGFEEI